jgi:branched-chain amino acid transport system ATP-binding protein
MLRLEGIDTGYGRAQVLRGFSMDVAAGEIHCLLGRNGAGKTTTMKAITGLLPLWAGKMVLDGDDISTLPAHEVARRGVGYIPQGRRLFTELTVAQNLEIGLMTRGSGRAVRDHVLDLFPRLRERLTQRAQTLSGGEQQMLATARALCIDPKVLLLDEPTEGLQPSMIEAIRDVILRLRGEGVAILLVEQRIDAVLSVADRVTFIENGQSRETVAASDLSIGDPRIERYMGV